MRGAGDVGRCLYGAVSYSVHGQLRDVINCRCSQCRRFHSHFATYTAALRSAVTIQDRDNPVGTTISDLREAHAEPER